MRPNTNSITQASAICQSVFVQFSRIHPFEQVLFCYFMQVSILILAEFVVLYSQKG